VLLIGTLVLIYFLFMRMGMMFMMVGIAMI